MHCLNIFPIQFNKNFYEKILFRLNGLSYKKKTKLSVNLITVAVFFPLPSSHYLECHNRNMRNP